jgi:hypothetical protein
MKKIFLLLIAFSPLLSHCQVEKELAQYPKMVGDIDYNSQTDKKDFELCNPNYIFQYFNNSGGLEYKGEKIALEQAVTKQYNPKKAKSESGWLRIRFVVNCKGKTDRFRLIGMNEKYQPHTFDQSISNQLLQITKNLSGWLPKKYEGKPIDYYQYLIFKLHQGHIQEILP